MPATSDANFVTPDHAYPRRKGQRPARLTCAPAKAVAQYWVPAFAGTQNPHMSKGDKPELIRNDEGVVVREGTNHAA